MICSEARAAVVLQLSVPSLVTRPDLMKASVCMQCVQICDPWLVNAVLELGTKRPDLIDKPRGWPLPIYDCFDRVRPQGTSSMVPSKPSGLTA